MDRRGDYGGYPNKRRAYGMDPMGFAGRAAIVKSLEVGDLTPIRALNPNTDRWLIVATCTAKSDIRKFVNKNGEGRIFNFDLIDSEESEIQCTCFGDTVDRFFPVIEVGRFYQISKGKLVQRSRYCHLDHEYEIRLNNGSVVDMIPEQLKREETPLVKYKFKTIEAVKKMEEHSVVDVLGVIVSTEPCRTITKKKGDEGLLKIVTIKDQTGFAVNVSLWDDHALNTGKAIDLALEDGQIHIIAGKGFRVVHFKGISLTVLGSSIIELDPDLQEAKLLLDWAVRSGSFLPIQTLHQPVVKNERCVLADISLNSMELDKPSYFDVCATVVYLKSNAMLYPACPLQRKGKTCLKKLTGEEGNFCCEVCGQGVEKPSWKYRLALQIRDHTGSPFITAFDVSEEIIGISAAELRLTRRTPAFANYIENARFKTKIFTLKAFVENWNGDMRLRLTAVRQEDIDFAEEANNLLSIIEKYGHQYEHKAGVFSQASQGYCIGSVQPAIPQYARAGHAGFMGYNSKKCGLSKIKKEKL